MKLGEVRLATEEIPHVALAAVEPKLPKKRKVYRYLYGGRKNY